MAQVFFSSSFLSAMDFSSVGSVEPVAGKHRARVRWNADGKFEVCRGPCRPDEEAAKDDLESMRAATRGMSREAGIAAMAAEAKRLREGKPTTEGGCVKEIERSYRAVFCCQDERDIKGPRRAEKASC